MSVTLGTVAAMGFEKLPPGQLLPLYRSLGCRAAQVYRNVEAAFDIAQTRRLIADAGLVCDSLHGVFGADYDPSSPDESFRRKTIDTYRSEANLVRELGGELVVVHCSPALGEGQPAQYDRRLAQFRKSVVELGEIGAAAGVKFALENLPGNFAFGADVAELAGILVELAAPNTGMCFDTGHANMTGDAVKSLLATRGQVIFVHFSDNRGRSDDHDMPTAGSLDTLNLGRALHQIDYHGTLMLEVFYGVDRLRALIEHGLKDRLAAIVAAANGELPS